MIVFTAVETAVVGYDDDGNHEQQPVGRGEDDEGHHQRQQHQAHDAQLHPAQHAAGVAIVVVVQRAEHGPERRGVTPGVVGLHGQIAQGARGLRSTREAMKWIFDAKEGEVSPLYECGNNDNLLVVALTKIHPVGYRDLDGVKDMLKQEVLRDKKFETLKSKLANVKTIADAQKAGAKVDSVNQITFMAPVFVQATGSSEPALSGAVSLVAQGQFSKAPVKENGGAYVFQVVRKTDREGAKFDAKAQEQMLSQQAMQAASRFMSELYQKANVVDNRYLFF